MQCQAPWWLPEGHTQTIVAARWVKRPCVQYHRLRWGTPDGDFLDLDFTAPVEHHASFKTMWVLFHGLEGSSSSHYSLSLMNQARELGVLGVVVHFRGCSGALNVQPRAYHSGDTQEIDWVLRRFREQFPRIQMLHALGVSLGGNALLKWLGEQGHSAASVVNAAVAVSAPVQLAAGAQALSKGFSRVYTRMFLSTLIPKAIQMVQAFPHLGSVDAISGCKTFADFDGLVTAPWHGFESAQSYWQLSSAKPVLVDIRVPTLMINALNDPFLPACYLPASHEVSSWVQCVFPKQGGHVGFVCSDHGSLSLNWLPNACQNFLHSMGAQ